MAEEEFVVLPSWVLGGARAERERFLYSYGDIVMKSVSAPWQNIDHIDLYFALPL